MRVLNISDEGVGLRVLVGNAHAGEEERNGEEREGRFPEDQGVGQDLKCCTEHQRSARADPRCDVVVGKGSHQPA